MKTGILKITAGVTVMIAGLLSFQNCAPTNFQAGQPSDIAQNVDSNGNPIDPNNPGNPGGNPTPTPTPITGNPTPTPGGPTDPVIYPKMTLLTPDCQPNTMCPVTFRLDKAHTKALSFDWNTHDTRYQTDPVQFGQPGVHFVSATGSLNFAIGETQKIIYIQSLNITNTIRIPFQWRNCMFGGAPLSCQSLQ